VNLPLVDLRQNRYRLSVVCAKVVRMATEFQVTFDSADPAAHAAFWAEALHYVLAPPPSGFESWDAALDAWGVPP